MSGHGKTVLMFGIYSMNVKELFDIASDSCNYRKKALLILRRDGMAAAVEYLRARGGNPETLKMAEGIETKDWRTNVR